MKRNVFLTLLIVMSLLASVYDVSAAMPGRGPGGCTDNAAFVADVTVPDNTTFRPGESIDKKWRVRNNGTCPWEPGYRLTFVSGDKMGASNTQTVSPVAPGDAADIAVTMVAPNSPGTYQGAWQMANAEGETFGQKLTVVIQVPGASPAAGTGCTHATSIVPSDWRVTLCDPFDDNQNQWPAGKDTDAYLIADSSVIDGKYRREVKALQSVSSKVEPKGPSVSDFYLTAEAKRISGPRKAEYGVIFRKVDWENLYLFSIDDDQYFKCDLLYKGEWITLVDSSASSAIRPGEVNRLAVKVEGSHFVLFINDQQVAELDDSRLTTGGVGLAVELSKAGDEAVLEFDNFELRTPPSGRGPTPTPSAKPVATATVAPKVITGGPCCQPLQPGKGAIWFEHFVGTIAQADVGTHFFEIPAKQGDVSGCLCPQLDPGHYTMIYKTRTHGGSFDIDIVSGQTLHFPIRYAGYD